MEILPVPLHLFRSGAQIEFRIPSGVDRVRVEVGTVRHLFRHGPQNLMAILSRTVSSTGAVYEGVNPVTGTERMVNLCHAVTVVEPGTGPVTFEVGSSLNATSPADVAQYRLDGTISRRGHRWVVAGKSVSVPAVMRALVKEHITQRRESLGLLPGEVLDFEPLIRQLRKQGILSVRLNEPDAYPNAYCSGELDVLRFKRFLAQNLNRFKLSKNRV